MSVPVFGLRKSKFRSGELSGIRRVGSTVAALGTSDTAMITTTADQVAVIDRIDMNIAAGDTAAAVLTVTLTINGNVMVFADQTVAGRTRNETTTLRPKGTMIVEPSSTLLAKTNAAPGTNASAVWIQVHYRIMAKTAAIAAGLWVGTQFQASLLALSTSPTTLIATATVGTTRGLEINGITITGRQSNATSAANKTILVEFLDPADSTHRKVFKNCYASNDPSGSPKLIVNDCVIRGPLGYGLRVTSGEATSNAAVTVWGKYYIGSQSTYPGTGVGPASLTAAIDAGEYFWIYDESTSTADPHRYLFPNTTAALSNNVATIDGYAFSAATAAGGISTFDVIANSTAKSITGYAPLFGGGVGVGGAMTKVSDSEQAHIRIGDTPALRVVNAVGTPVVGMTVWGRFGGTSRKSTSLARDYLEA